MGVFGVWCGKCAKYLAFGTFTAPTVNALRFRDFFKDSIFSNIFLSGSMI